MSIPTFSYSIMGFSFNTVQLVDVTHADGTRERQEASAELRKSIEAGDVKATGLHGAVRIRHDNGKEVKQVYVPLLTTGEIK